MLELFILYYDTYYTIIASFLVDVDATWHECTVSNCTHVSFLWSVAFSGDCELILHSYQTQLKVLPVKHDAEYIS